MPKFTNRHATVALAVAGVLAALVAATGLVALLEAVLGIENASSVYLLAVVAIAISMGTAPAVAAAVGAFGVYNFLFVEPRFTLTVARPAELVTLFLLLVVGVVSGRLAGLQRDRQRQAEQREREARALFAISRELSTADRLTDAMQAVTGRLAADAGMDRTWIGIGATISHERVVAGSAGTAEPRPSPGTHAVLQRDRDETAAIWTRVHPATAGSRTPHRASLGGPRPGLFRVELRAADETVGSLWSARAASAGQPGIEETRLLAAAADQLGLAVRRERLQTQAAELEIARRSDELKSALVDSVSHDLRTPLATIRAAAGSLADPAIDLAADDRRLAARAIDDEAARLNRLVGDLLDMSRIQGGALVADIEVVPLAEVVEPAVKRAQLTGTRAIEVELPADLPPVHADVALLDRVISNLLENARKYAGPEARIRVRGERRDDESVSLVVEDGGPGVPDEALPHLFDRFYRVSQSDEGSRRGFGLGLAVVAGLVEAMDGSVSAARSELGGLAVTVPLPAAGLS